MTATPLRQPVGVLVASIMALSCAGTQQCAWTCHADAYDEAERRLDGVGDVPLGDRNLEARQASETALWVACVPSTETIARRIVQGPLAERRRAVILAVARQYDSPDIISAVLTRYPLEPDALARIRMVRVLKNAKVETLQAMPLEGFAPVRAEADPRVMAAAILLANRVEVSQSVQWWADYIQRGPAWVGRLAYGAAVDRGVGEKVKAELSRRGAEDGLRLISELENAKDVSP